MWVLVSGFFESPFELVSNWFRCLSNLIQESTLKELTSELKKQSEEMRKLKAIIVKHENRIRSLEAAQKAREDDVLDAILYNDKKSTDNNKDVVDADAEITKTPSAGNLAPDEV